MAGWQIGNRHFAVQVFDDSVYLCYEAIKNFWEGRCMADDPDFQRSVAEFIGKRFRRPFPTDWLTEERPQRRGPG